MKQKHKRLIFLIFVGLCLTGAGILTAKALRESILYFVSPTDLITETNKWVGKKIRLGGLVKQGTLVAKDGMDVAFTITDEVHDIPVAYSGILPDLFREGQGVVAEGVLENANTFKAIRILAKHDETYMPPEVAEALKKSGKWKG